MQTIKYSPRGCCRSWRNRRPYRRTSFRCLQDPAYVFFYFPKHKTNIEEEASLRAFRLGRSDDSSEYLALFRIHLVTHLQRSLLRFFCRDLLFDTVTEMLVGRQIEERFIDLIKKIKLDCINKQSTSSSPTIALVSLLALRMNEICSFALSLRTSSLRLVFLSNISFSNVLNSPEHIRISRPIHWKS